MALVRRAMGMPSRSGGWAARGIPSVAGCDSAPKTPWATRSPITQPMSGARPIPTDAAPKPTIPTAKTCWWPYRSPSHPANTNRPATAMR
jgi:hypothetical protein